MGGSWNLSKEPTINLEDLFSDLRLRTTYGVAGNVNKSLTHYPVVRHTASNTPGLLSYATVTSYGNPSLRWERVETFNMGLDWQWSNKRLMGNIEFYTKMGKDLIGDDYLDPTLGIIDPNTLLPGLYKINYANIRTVGWDFSLTTKNLIGPLQWATILTTSLVNNTITNYNTNENVILNRYFSNPPPKIKQSRDAIYSIPWHGLSAQNGLPIIYFNGNESFQYSDYRNQLTHDDLIINGTSIPTAYGSIRNQLKWRGLELGLMMKWKGNYRVRRDSYSTFDEYKANYHEDYFLRWKQPGDELTTHVPASLPKNLEGDQIVNLPFIYENSSVLVEKGDHIRFQEVTLNYSLPSSAFGRIPIQSLTVSGNVRNLGILWKASKNLKDPDYSTTSYPNPRIFSISVSCSY